MEGAAGFKPALPFLFRGGYSPKFIKGGAVILSGELAF
jgi:hypothetical protein